VSICRHEGISAARGDAAAAIPACRFVLRSLLLYRGDGCHAVDLRERRAGAAKLLHHSLREERGLAVLHEAASPMKVWPFTMVATVVAAGFAIVGDRAACSRAFSRSNASDAALPSFVPQVSGRPRAWLYAVLTSITRQSSSHPTGTVVATAVGAPPRISVSECFTNTSPTVAPASCAKLFQNLRTCSGTERICMLLAGPRFSPSSIINRARKPWLEPRLLCNTPLLRASSCRLQNSGNRKRG